MADQVPSHMNGYLLEEFNKPYVYHTDIPIPKLEPGTLLIRVKVAGFCHTEFMVKKGLYSSPLPLVPGHETVGVVAAIGEGVQEFQIGDRVGTLLYRGACGTCRECIRGTPEYCADIQLAGLTSNGGMAQYALADVNWAVRLPDGMSFARVAPLMCAGATVYHSLLRSGVEHGIIGIIGVGGLGHLAVQFAKAMGHRVVAVDTRAAPLELCRSLPEHLQADLVFNANELDANGMLTRVKESLVDEGVGLPATGLDAVLVCTDAHPAFALGIEILAKHGTLVFVGLPERPVPMPYTAFVGKDITVVAGCLPCGRWSGVGAGGVYRKYQGKEIEGKRWMSAKEVMEEMLVLVEKVKMHVELTEYPMDEIERLVTEFGSEKSKGKLVLRVEDD